MRELKFRVWDNQEKVYLSEKDIAIDNLGNVFLFEGYDDNDAERWYARILSDLNNKRYVVEWSTGLKDKNGIEVYSGDIVERVSLGSSKQVVTGEILFDEVNKMKIIDFEKKGNVVRFYLGSDDCKDYYGDDWDDRSYEHNAGLVYEEYVTGHRDVAFPFEYAVVEPCDGVMNSKWSKDDMKERRVPCIIAVSNADRLYEEYFNEMSHSPQAIRFYFGDEMTPSDKIEIYKKK